MKNIYLITNSSKDPDRKLTEKVKNIFSQAGLSCVEGHRSLPEPDKGFLYTDIQDIPSDTEAIITIGGDGTMIQGFRDTKELDIPLIGINMGTLGYLAEIEPKNIEDAAIALRDGHFHIEERMLLEGCILDENIQTDRSVALNDIVINRVGSLRVIEFNIRVNSKPLVSVNADGIIVSTPTGSTGYNLSAGGPIVEPSARLIVITPICAHTLKMRSIVLSADDIVEIEPVIKGEGAGGILETSFDGRHVVPVKGGNVIHVAGSKQIMRMIRLSTDSFMQILHKKMED